MSFKHGSILVLLWFPILAWAQGPDTVAKAFARVADLPSEEAWREKYGRAMEALKRCCENPTLEDSEGRKVCLPQ